MSLKIFKDCLVGRIKQWGDLGRRSSVNFVEAWNRSSVQAVGDFAEQVKGKVDPDDYVENGYVISNESAIFTVSVTEGQLKVVTVAEGDDTAEETLTVSAMTAKINKDLFPPPLPFDAKGYYRAKIEKLKNKKRNNTQERKLADYTQQLERLEAKEGSSGSGSGSGSGKGKGKGKK